MKMIFNNSGEKLGLGIESTAHTFGCSVIKFKEPQKKARFFLKKGVYIKHHPAQAFIREKPQDIT